ncbi:phospholipid transport system substrate-binding protein [Rhizomicrobium palustre]|uniref:Phospholipid transport system substrate-binding protein n=1 Tax=Rhizomicrobium palustre TaxID=189966 RepID=A0A846MZY7_9PROT|nr:ABC transporter substrate-binding protein [Rhizomicrobium palustre]NIK88805.1 phospholipid transport system substrate-binding protein [Rhizomicrobium palustre]
MTKSLFQAASLAALLMVPAAYAEVPADPAVAPVQSFYDTLIATMKQGKQLGVKGRYEKLKPVIEQSFDLPGMTRLSVGPAWNTMSEADQKALTAALSRYTIASYASNFKSFDGEKFTVDPASTVRGADKVVTSKLTAGKDVIPFNYRMRQAGSSWKIIDIFLNGYVSQIAKQRSDFAATMQSGGAAALEKKLDTLSDGLMKD